MYKLVLLPTLITFLWMLQAFQIDQEIAMHTLFRAKHAVNRAVHAAAQQVNTEQLSRGVYAIDPARARTAAEQYLQTNLDLDASLMPVEGSFFKQQIEVLVFEVISEEAEFPYHYYHPAYHYEVTLNKPGVIMIVKIEYPRIYPIIEPITWHVKGTSELTMP